jgi:hypothetical protein
MAFSPTPSISVTDYFIGLVFEGSINLNYDSGSFGTNFYAVDLSNNFATPQTLGASGFSIYRAGFYCDYTPTPSGLSIPVAQHHYLHNMRV